MSIKKNTNIWVPDDTNGFKKVVCGYVDDEEVTVYTEAGDEDCFPLKSCYPANAEFQTGLEDMIELSFLHEPALLENLRYRFQWDLIYTYVGHLLIAVNPYQRLPCTTPAIVAQYCANEARAPDGSRLAPHPYTIGDQAYRSLRRDTRSQSIIISGESGAGKTETTKIILQYIAHVGGRDGVGRLEQQILQTNPILEAFGNAKTLRNDNSSRFGKFIQIMFDKDGFIYGANIRTYLLEKSRLVYQAPMERNYHIWYQYLAGLTPEQKTRYQLLKPADYHYLNQSECMEIKGVSDREEFQAMTNALSVIGVSESDVDGVFTVLASLLALGNIIFAEGKDDDSFVKNGDVVSTCCNQFGVDEAAMNYALCKKQVKAGVEYFEVARNSEEAGRSRDALAKATYRRLFDFLVVSINVSLACDAGNQTFIGVLDIFGFESFETNSFEQLCINYANEKLQQFFNQHVIENEQKEYVAEKIDWSFVEFVDNQPCLDLLEKKPKGVLSLLDEECVFPNGSDSSYTGKVTTMNDKHTHFKKSRFSQTQFSVSHYAGEVCYSTSGWLDKNNDNLHENLTNMMLASTKPFVAALFAPTAAGDSSSKKSTSGGGGASKKPATFISVGNQFKEQLATLMTTLNQTYPYFVRCIKPNPMKVPREFENNSVMHQLRCGGVVEAVRVCQAGFPTRYPYGEIFPRYSMLLPRDKRTLEPREGMKAVLAILNMDSGFQFGATKLFFRVGKLAHLEDLRNEKLAAHVVKMQCFVRGYQARKRFKEMLRRHKASIALQCRIRALLCRAVHGRSRIAASMLQSQMRCMTQRAAFILEVKCRHEAAAVLQVYARAKLAALAYIYRKQREEEARIAEEKRKEEERLAEERRKEEERLAELRRIEEEKRKAEEERLRKEEEARLAKEAEERRIAEEKRLAEEARLRQEEEARLAREAEERRIAEEKRKAEEERLRREEEARIKREEEERRLAEEQRRLEEEARLKAEAEARRQQLLQEEREKRENEERLLIMRMEEEARIRREEEERKAAAEAERLRLEAEATAERLRLEMLKLEKEAQIAREAEERRLAQLEAERQEREEAERRRVEEIERLQREAEAEAARKAAAQAEEEARLKREAELAKQREAEEAVVTEARAALVEANQFDQAKKANTLPTDPEPMWTDISQSPLPLQGHLKEMQALGLGRMRLPGNTLQPNRACLRREYMRWLVAVNNELHRDASKFVRLAVESSPPVFLDLPPTDPDFDSIQGLAEAGLIPSPLLDPECDPNFRPNAPLSREEMLSFKVGMDHRQFLGPGTVEEVKSLWSFVDSANISEAARGAVILDHSFGNTSNIIRSFGQGRLFMPKKPVTHAEAAASLWYVGGGSGTDESCTVAAFLHRARRDQKDMVSAMPKVGGGWSRGTGSFHGGSGAGSEYSENIPTDETVEMTTEESAGDKLSELPKMKATKDPKEKTQQSSFWRRISFSNEGGQGAPTLEEDDDDKNASHAAAVTSTASASASSVGHSGRNEDGEAVNPMSGEADSKVCKNFEHLLARARAEDLSDIRSSNAIRVVGRDKLGKPCVLILGKKVDARKGGVYLERLFYQFIHEVEPLVDQPYVLLYVNTGTSTSNRPDLQWLRKAGAALPRRYRKNLAGLFVVNPTFWQKAVAWFFKPFVKEKFWRKLVYLNKVNALWDHFEKDDILDALSD